jgi:hypothetical protein
MKWGNEVFDVVRRRNKFDFGSAGEVPDYISLIDVPASGSGGMAP